MTESLRRYFTWFVVFATILWALGALTLVAGVSNVARAASAGDLIKMDGNPAVYYLGSDSKRYVFPNEKTFKTWYAGFTGVVTVSQSELESYAIGGNVTYRAGTYMVKITTDPKVYAVEPSGVLRHVTTEAIAKSLYGDNWNQWIQDVPDPFFVNYTVGSAITTATYPTGTLVKETGNSTTYYVDGSTKRPIADEAAFNANKFQWKFVLSAASLSGYTAGTSITAGEAGIATVAGPGVTPVTGSGVTVSLASDTPASTTVVKSAQRVKFTKVNFTAAADGNAVIDSIKVKRGGLSNDSNIASVILIDAATDKQLGTEKTLGSVHDVTFNDDITVAAGTTKSYYLAANMHTTLQTGDVVTLELTEVKLSGNAAVSGTLPVVGNGMTMNNNITIGAITAAAGGNNPSAATKQVGTTNYIFSAVKLSNNSVEEVQVEAIRFYQNGTAADADLANLKLEVDGTQVATVSKVASKEVFFDLSSNPVVIKKGLNKEFALKGDIVDGSSRTISFDFEKQTDVKVKGKTYGFYINPTYPNTSTPYFNGPDCTISVGTLTVSKATLASTNIAEGSTQQPLGAFYMQAKGEKVNITSFNLNVAISASAATIADVTNLTIYDEAGTVVAGPFDITDNTGTDGATSTDTIVVPVGTTKYTVKGDLNTDFVSGDTIALTIDTPADFVAKGDVTNQTVTASPSSAVTLDTVTVKVGGLLISTSASPASQTVVAGTSGFTFANFVFDATNSGEDVKITNVKVRHEASSANLHDYIQNITLYDGATALNTPQGGEQSTSAVTATSTLTLTNALVITKGTSKTLTLKADISANAANASTHAFGLAGTDCVTAVGADSATTVTPDTTSSHGRTMYIASTGSLTVATDASNPTAALVTAGSTGVTIGEMRITATNEDAKITGLTFAVASTNSGNATNDLAKVYVYDGATEVGSVTPTSTGMVTVTIPDGSLVVTKGTTGKKVTIKADFQCVGSGCPASSGHGVTLSAVEDSYVGKGVSSGSEIAAANKSGTFSGNTFSLYKSVPTVSFVDVASLSAGTSRPVFKFKVTAPSAGDVGFYKAAFVVSTTSATVSSFELYETDTDTNLTNNGARNVDALFNPLSSDGKGGVYGLSILFDTGSDYTQGTSSGGEYRTIPAGGSRTYELRASVTTSETSGRTVSITLLGDDSFPSSYPLSANDIDTGEDDDFIWSDLNYGNNSTTATNTMEWTNGYRVTGLTSTSTSLTENFNW